MFLKKFIYTLFPLFAFVVNFSYGDDSFYAYQEDRPKNRQRVDNAHRSFTQSALPNTSALENYLDYEFALNSGNLSFISSLDVDKANGSVTQSDPPYTSVLNRYPDFQNTFESGDLSSLPIELHQEEWGLVRDYVERTNLLPQSSDAGNLWFTTVAPWAELYTELWGEILSCQILDDQTGRPIHVAHRVKSVCKRLERLRRSHTTQRINIRSSQAMKVYLKKPCIAFSFVKIMYEVSFHQMTRLVAQTIPLFGLEIVNIPGSKAQSDKKDWINGLTTLQNLSVSLTFDLGGRKFSYKLSKYQKRRVKQLTSLPKLKYLSVDDLVFKSLELSSNDRKLTNIKTLAIFQEFQDSEEIDCKKLFSLGLTNLECLSFLGYLMPKNPQTLSALVKLEDLSLLYQSYMLLHVPDFRWVSPLTNLTRLRLIGSLGRPGLTDFVSSLTKLQKIEFIDPIFGIYPTKFRPKTISIDVWKYFTSLLNLRTLYLPKPYYHREDSIFRPFGDPLNDKERNEEIIRLNAIIGLPDLQIVFHE